MRLIWGVKAPRRISFFTWTAARGKILTCDNLMRRGHVLAGWCCLCKNQWETVDHLLLHCEVAVALWGFVFSMFGVQRVFPAMVLDMVSGWHNWFGRHSSAIWNLAPLCVMWSLWQERNRRIFEDAEKSVSHLQEHFLACFLIVLGRGVSRKLLLFLILLYPLLLINFVFLSL
jgi:hypothetical protein